MSKDLIIKPTQAQHKVLKDNDRFKVVIAGRRFGKTELSKMAILTIAMKYSNMNIAYIAPTYDQAKRIMWKRLTDELPKQLIQKRQDSSPQTLEIINNSVISLHGAKNIGNLRGEGFNLIIMDEAAEIDESAWYEVIRPALSDRNGKALLIGTPKGFNWIYDITKDRTFKYYSFTTLDGGLVSKDEIELAKSQLDEKTFKQEYEASFENATGLVYYAFSEANEKDITFNPSAATYLCWDFNVNPMSCILNQKIDNNKYCFVKEFSHRDSNTEETALAIDRWLAEQNFSGTLEVTGDPSGTSRKTSAAKTDWQIIENIFKNYNGYKKNTRRTKHIKDRVHFLNSAFKSYDGTIRQYINTNECKVLKNDLVRVLYKDNGTLDDAGGKLTHMSDAASYFAYNYLNYEDKPTISKVA